VVICELRFAQAVTVNSVKADRNTLKQGFMGFILQEVMFYKDTPFIYISFPRASEKKHLAESPPNPTRK
jgi:hypothetical protein